MSKIIFTLAALALAVSNVYADPGNQGGGNGGCGVGQQTNGCGSTSGAGGQGGTGGTGIGAGVGIGLGGSVAGSGNSHNANTNVNANSNTSRNSNRNQQRQAQGQQQGQAQQANNRQQQNATAMQGQSSRNDNRSSAANTNSNANSGNNASQTVNVGGSVYEAARIPVATAYAAPLAASNGTCMGSTSVGGQMVGFGISVGSTWNDSSCDMRYDAEALRMAGMPSAAIARLCQKPEIAAAMLAAGTPCARPVASAAPAASAQRDITVQELAVRYSGTDPIVRKRMGLPPLK